jgi:hypothetical protein
MPEEKRKFERFKVKEGAFAAFIIADQLIDMGQIMNISMGGLCFRYLAGNVIIENRTMVKIFGRNDHFIHLDRVQCRVVYEYEVSGEFWINNSTKCCGVAFQNLSVEHQVLWKDFTDHFRCRVELAGAPQSVVL